MMRLAKSRLLPLLVLLCVAACSSGDPDEATPSTAEEANFALTTESASRFARLALDCIHREYPNKLNQVLSDATQLLPPRDLHPAFFGCFDWHSSVHGHWMLSKLLKEFPELPERQQVIDGLSRSLSPDNIAGEVAYFDIESASWERTYGWAWLLQLATELERWDDPLGRQWAVSLEPLTRLIRDRYIEFLPRQEYPIRTGVHPNTAFGLSFAFDYAETVADSELMDSIVSAARRYYADDENCPLSWEPGGEDFLSPCFEEAALMARVLPDADYQRWLTAFLPSLSDPTSLLPANVSDRSDPKIVHLDGLNLSRAWNLYVIANELDDAEAATRLRDKADEHLAASLPHITSEHYEGSHWLGSFAIYALTR
jgi:hypothetical protein